MTDLVDQVHAEVEALVEPLALGQVQRVRTPDGRIGYTAYGWTSGLTVLVRYGDASAAEWPLGRIVRVPEVQQGDDVITSNGLRRVTGGRIGRFTAPYLRLSTGVCVWADQVELATDRTTPNLPEAAAPVPGTPVPPSAAASPPAAQAGGPFPWPSR